MYLRLIKVPPHVKILTSMGPTGPRFLAFLPSKSSGGNSSSSSLFAWVLHKIYYILPTLLEYKYAFSVVLAVLMVVEVICLPTSTSTYPAKEQVEVLQVQVLQVQVPTSTDAFYYGKCHFKFTFCFLEPFPYYKYKYLPSKAVNGNSPGSAFSPPTTLCSPPACPHLRAIMMRIMLGMLLMMYIYYDEVYVCVSRKMSTSELSAGGAKWDVR